VQDQTIQVSASIGYSSYLGNENVDAETIIKQADDAMYRVKSHKSKAARNKSN
jgi:GGDEF domain-containing protein